MRPLGAPGLPVVRCAAALPRFQHLLRGHRCPAVLQHVPRQGALARQVLTPQTPCSDRAAALWLLPCQAQALPRRPASCQMSHPRSLNAPLLRAWRPAACKSGTQLALHESMHSGAA